MLQRKIKKCMAVAIATLSTILIAHQLSVTLNSSDYPLSPITEAIAQEAQGVPTEQTMCMPSDLSESELSSSRLVGQHQGEHSLFSAWEIEDNGIPFLFVNSFYGGDGGVCGHVFDSRYESYMSSEYIAEADAKSLSILIYEDRIARVGGLDSFQAILDESLAEPGPSYFAPEFIYAMRELGVRLPEGEVEAISPDTQFPRR